MDVAELSFCLGEGNNVGRLIPVQILFVNGLDLLIINQDQAYFLVVAVQCEQNFTNRLSQPPETDRYFFLPVFDQELHAGLPFYPR